ncbi:MAG: AAA family ATPase [Holosporaceae bacterium]|jgi:replication-associated recombination protein RarA|nr:AAA family ATPase [Holosporaceae bacterium]
MIYQETFSILGHEKAEATLAHSIVSGKIYPTWIFLGPFGVGKSTVAHRFAKCLLSDTIPSESSLDISPENPIHKLVKLRTHPDFFVLEQRENSVSIDETRELLQKIHKTPSISKWKVLILENAANLNKNIYNSLLKVLEEPPKNTVIIMICDNIGHIPKTLTSRAAKLRFGAIDTCLVEKILKGRGVEPAKKIAALSGGSIGAAIYIHQHNGVDVFDHLLAAFDCSTEIDNHKKHLKYLLDNKLCENFFIIKKSITYILKIYVDIINDNIDNEHSDVVGILKNLRRRMSRSLDAEVKKIMDIIVMLNNGEHLMLDKNSLLVHVFEKFFS